MELRTPLKVSERNFKPAILMMKSTHDSPILVTGAAGAIGAIGRNLTAMLLAKGHKVRALVRREDERAQALARRTRIVPQFPGAKEPLQSVRTVALAGADLFAGVKGSWCPASETERAGIRFQ